jgi:hypothetical protein
MQAAIYVTSNAVDRLWQTGDGRWTCEKDSG